VRERRVRESARERRERGELSLSRGESASERWVRGEREVSLRERAREARGVRESSALSVVASARENGE